MYSTRLVNSHMVDGNAYITVGDPYKEPNPNPFRNAKPRGKDEKPLDPFRTTGHPKNAENGMFTKLEHKGGDAQSVNAYLKTQPLEERKKGFGSHDAKRRDEFSNAMRTEQYRATIKKEKELLKVHSNHDIAEYLEKEMPGPEVDESKRVYQYDIGRTRVTEFDPKQKKDSYYKSAARPMTATSGATMRPDSSLGFRTTSSDWGKGTEQVEYHAPEFGGQTATAHFYDKSHIHK